MISTVNGERINVTSKTMQQQSWLVVELEFATKKVKKQNEPRMQE